MPKVFEYEVVGDGTFPLDMLRYDNAWPALESQIHQIPKFKAGREERTILIRSHKKPTDKRWESFGWKITTKRVY